VKRVIGLAEVDCGCWSLAVECPKCWELQWVPGGAGEIPAGGRHLLEACRCEQWVFVTVLDTSPWPSLEGVGG
jgi:hypothetical protein